MVTHGIHSDGLWWNLVHMCILVHGRLRDFTATKTRPPPQPFSLLRRMLYMSPLATTRSGCESVVFLLLIPVFISTSGRWNNGSKDPERTNSFHWKRYHDVNTFHYCRNYIMRDGNMMVKTYMRPAIEMLTSPWQLYLSHELKLRNAKWWTLMCVSHIGWSNMFVCECQQYIIVLYAAAIVLCFLDRFRNTCLSYLHFFCISFRQVNELCKLLWFTCDQYFCEKRNMTNDGGNCYTLVACMCSQCRSFYVYESKQSFKPDNWIKQSAWVISIARPMFHGMLLDAFCGKNGWFVFVHTAAETNL